MPTPLEDPTAFQTAITQWFSAHGKDYPWRRTEDPYAILVSEMMLQQTQIATVLGKRYFERWLELFPTPQALAQAPEPEVLRAWEGLGYYQRARNLQRAAREVVTHHDGKFPRSVAELLKLPGLGRYTAGAVATFAFDASEPIVDANIARVLARLFNYRLPIDADAGKNQIWAWAEQLVPQRHGRIYNSGLMELGQRICTGRAPQCELCPVARHCAGRWEQPETLPLKQPKRSTVRLVEHVAWAVRRGEILLHQEQGQRRQGLWKLPERDEAWFTRHLSAVLHDSHYTITHHRVRLLVYEASTLVAGPDESWQPLDDISTLPMPSPYRKVVEALLGRPNSIKKS